MTRPATVDLDAAWAVTEEARLMCIKATHEHPVVEPPCIPHVVESAEAARARPEVS